MPVGASQRGFTLLEAAVSAGLLLLACTAISHTVLATIRNEGMLGAQARAEALAEAERVRLLALPFATTDEGGGAATGETERSSLLAEVFPSSATTPGAATGYQVDASGAASFVSQLRLTDATLERRARFVRRGPDGRWQTVSGAELAAWTSAGDAAPPAGTVEVLITVDCRGRSGQRQLLAGALSQATADEAHDVQ